MVNLVKIEHIVFTSTSTVYANTQGLSRNLPDTY